MGVCPIRWVTCTTPLQDARLRQPVDPGAHCPLFEPGKGCMAYEVRPLACRMFGPMHPRATPLPEPCVFIESKACESVQDIPLWEEYAEVIRRHRPSPPGYFVAKPAES
jgi:Fe-S-cluster containining protein